MELSLLQIEHWVNGFLWPLFRVMSFFMAMPIIGTQMLPVRLRLGLALAVTVLLVPVLPPMPEFDALSLQNWIVVAQQVLIGSLLGFSANILLQSFVVGGQLMAMQMGLGFASMTDPANGVSVVIVAQIYLMLVMLLFLGMDGHLVLIEILAQSFHVLPVGAGSVSQATLWHMALSGGWLFMAALLMALPAVTALLVINFAFGIMTKAAPQLNIFAIGFPFTMLMGIVIVWLSLSGFFSHYQVFAAEALGNIAGLLTVEGPGG
ncbi:MAG: flagellar type III secretion system protein FliR [Oceanospirillales bacterium]|nr:flagellar type III secretion system protein FliR [Oceanospirillales bacterium]